MANPQPDKYIKISTELFEALCKIRIPGEARQVFDVVIRKTWGFNKKMDNLSMSQIAEMTGLSRSSVSRAISKLLEMNMLLKKDSPETTFGVNFLGIQKNYELWRVFTKKITPSDSVYENVNTPPDLFEEEPMKEGVYENVNTPEEVFTKKRTEVFTKKSHTIDTYIYTYNTYGLFEELWKQYPRKIGKPQAYDWFKKTIRSEQDLNDIKTSLKNYLKYIEKNKTEMKYIKHGNAWFHIWKNWLEYEEHNPNDKQDTLQRKIDEDKLRKHIENK